MLKVTGRPAGATYWLLGPGLPRGDGIMSTFGSWFSACAAGLAAGGMLLGVASGEVRAENSVGIVDVKPADGPAVEVDGKFMVPYKTTIPGTKVEFAMIPVPGGEFLLGSPDDEPERGDDEGPQVRVKVAPFWIGKHEVTWAEYQAYMKMYNAFKQLQTLAANRGDAAAKEGDAEGWELIEQHAWSGDAEDPGVDGVTSPTPLYMPDHTYMAGDRPNQPAVTMTHFAARQFTKWLSGLTGQEYRLPSEAEWEYAARAGTTTPYSFGDDPGETENYGWLEANADYETHPVGEKAPNPWGLFDMHGNVAEWTLDGYAEDAYEKLGEQAKHGKAIDAWEAVNWPTELYPRVIRGGSWLDTAERLRSAARHRSEEEDWKMSDPNLPLSPWWYTEEPAMGVGMRLVRPYAPLTAEDKKRVWEIDAEDLAGDVKTRLKEGRGAVGNADATLPQAVEAATRIGSGK